MKTKTGCLVVIFWVYIYHVYPEISIKTFLSFAHEFTDFSQYLLEPFVVKELLVLRLHHILYIILLVFNYDGISLLLIYTSLWKKYYFK